MYYIYMGSPRVGGPMGNNKASLQTTWFIYKSYVLAKPPLIKIASLNQDSPMLDCLMIWYSIRVWISDVPRRCPTLSILTPDTSKLAPRSTWASSGSDWHMEKVRSTGQGYRSWNCSGSFFGDLSSISKPRIWGQNPIFFFLWLMNWQLLILVHLFVPLQMIWRIYMDLRRGSKGWEWYCFEVAVFINTVAVFWWSTLKPRAVPFAIFNSSPETEEERDGHKNHHIHEAWTQLVIVWHCFSNNSCNAPVFQRHAFLLFSQQPSRR